MLSAEKRKKREIRTTNYLKNYNQLEHLQLFVKIDLEKIIIWQLAKPFGK